MCCKVMTVREAPVFKEDGEWCPFCSMREGCTIYEDRPITCRTFKCAWLESQELGVDAALPLELRPDKSKVVIAATTDPKVIMAYVDPGFRSAWKEHKTLVLLKVFMNRGVRVCISDGPSLKKIVLHTDEHGVIHKRTREFTPPDDDGIQWTVPEKS